MSKNTEKTTKKINLLINSCQFIAIVFAAKFRLKGKHALEYFLTREKSHGKIKFTYIKRFLPPCSLIVENVFFIVLPRNR